MYWLLYIAEYERFEIAKYKERGKYLPYLARLACDN